MARLTRILTVAAATLALAPAAAASAAGPNTNHLPATAQLGNVRGGPTGARCSKCPRGALEA